MNNTNTNNNTNNNTNTNPNPSYPVLVHFTPPAPAYPVLACGTSGWRCKPLDETSQQL